MYRIIIYKDRRGREPVADYIKEMYSNAGKDARINKDRINDHIEALSRFGTEMGMPFVKHVRGSLWELRPLKNRIFFFGVDGDTYVLLHAFYKKTRKTPIREIQKAEREMKDYLSGRYDDGIQDMG